MNLEIELIYELDFQIYYSNSFKYFLAASN
jgi:hypothetical protein